MVFFKPYKAAETDSAEPTIAQDERPARITGATSRRLSLLASASVKLPARAAKTFSTLTANMSVKPTAKRTWMP